MAVDYLRAPAKRLEALFERLKVVAQRSGLALAQAVHIHNGDQVVELVQAGQRGGFPN